MKQLINFTDQEKIEAFDRIYKDAQEALQELTKEDNSDYFDERMFLEDMVGDILELTKEDWESRNYAIH